MTDTHILNIGTSLNGKLINLVPYTRYSDAPNIISGHNIRDADVLFWDVKTATFPYEQYQQAISPQMFFENELALNKLRGNFEEFFQLGRVLVLPSPNFSDHKFHVTDVSTHVTEKHLSFIDGLPLQNTEVERLTGSNIVGAENAATEFLRRNGYYLHYTLIFKNTQGTPLMHVKGSKAVVAQCIRYKNGIILLFPNIQLPNDSFAYLNFFNDLYQLIQEIKTQKPSAETIAIPAWAKEYLIEGEREEIAKLGGLENERTVLEQSINNQMQTLTNINNLKFLFAGDGNELEQAVEFVFSRFGFDILHPDDNRDDLIIKTGEKVGVIEVKGTVKSGAEKHAAQLEKWVLNYLEINDVHPKGILVVNTYKNDLVVNRNGKDFPDQMLAFSKARGHCLLTGLQLLALYVDFTAQRISFHEVVELLFNTTGVLSYNASPTYLAKVNL